MTDPDIPLHPRLRKLGARQHRLMLMLNMVLFLTISGGIIAMMAITFSGGDLFDLLLLGVIGLLVLPLVALLSGLLRYLDRWLSRHLDRAGQLLREQQPLTARLVPMGLNNQTGTLVTLHPPEENLAHAGPLHALINPSFRWSAPPRREITVQLYCQELKPGHEWVALQPDGDVLLGKVVEWRTYYRQLWLVMVAAMTLTLILAGVVGTLAVREYGAYRQIEQDRQTAMASADWPHVPARIQRAELTTTPIIRGKSRVTGYQVRVVFEYTVGGVLRQGDTLHFCNRPTDNRQTAEAWLTPYPADATVTVRCDPADPALCVLEAGYTAACETVLAEKRLDVIFFSAVTGFLLLLALAVLGQFRRYRRALSTSDA